MWRFVLAENIPAGVAENFLILRCGATSPCAVTSKPLVCCGVKPAAAYDNMKALLEATAAIRRVRRIIALGFGLQLCVWLKVPPLGAQSVPRLAHRRENPRLTETFFWHLATSLAPSGAANGRHWGPTMRCERSRTDRWISGAFRFLVSYMPLACACDAAKNSRAGRQTFDRRLRTAALLTTSVVTRGEDARGPLVSHTSTASAVAGKHALLRRRNAAA